MKGDKAGKAYWNSLWVSEPLPPAIDAQGKGFNYYIDRKFCEFFKNVFNRMDTKYKTLLEIGCARSVWLPWLAKRFGFVVSGLDYSAAGCEQARRVLIREGITGHIYPCNFFDPPKKMLGSFDVVVSFGVVEHFDDTAAVIHAFSRFLKPGGLLITNVPNMAGFIGRLQKLCNRAVYDIHRPIDSPQLKSAHSAAGLEVISCDYFLSANFGVINLENYRQKRSYPVWIRLRSWISKFVWVIEPVAPFIKPNRLTSPYIHCVAIKPCG